MLYFNKPFRIERTSPNPRNKNCGISIGLCKNLREYRHLLKLPPGFADKKHVEAKLYPDLTIGHERGRGPLRILAEDDTRTFMIITSRLTSDSDFVGNIRVPRGREKEIKIITRGIAPKGTGQWLTLVVQARSGDAFYINWNRLDGSGAMTGFYYVDEYNSVHSCDQSGIPSLFTDLGITPSFTVRDDLDPLVSRIDRREWFKL